MTISLYFRTLKSTIIKSHDSRVTSRILPNLSWLYCQILTLDGHQTCLVTPKHMSSGIGWEIKMSNLLAIYACWKLEKMGSRFHTNSSFLLTCKIGAKQSKKMPSGLPHTQKTMWSWKEEKRDRWNSCKSLMPPPSPWLSLWTNLSTYP